MVNKVSWSTTDNILKRQSLPVKIVLLVCTVILFSFGIYKAWQEYQINSVNKFIDFFPTSSGGIAVVLNWQDNATNENGFIIERSNNGVANRTCSIRCKCNFIY